MIEHALVIEKRSIWARLCCPPSVEQRFACIRGASVRQGERVSRGILGGGWFSAGAERYALCNDL